MGVCSVERSGSVSDKSLISGLKQDSLLAGHLPELNIHDSVIWHSLFSNNQHLLTDISRYS